jgi:hypothetical protein
MILRILSFVTYLKSNLNKLYHHIFKMGTLPSLEYEITLKLFFLIRLNVVFDKMKVRWIVGKNVV